MGEKPTRYFCNLEKRNYEEKVILQLKTRSDEIITDIKEINKEIDILQRAPSIATRYHTGKRVE